VLNIAANHPHLLGKTRHCNGQGSRNQSCS
jgi:hypothetical protein